MLTKFKIDHNTTQKIGFAFLGLVASLTILPIIVILSLLVYRGAAAIYVSHDLAVVAQMADRIMVLRHGLEVEEAPTREMLRERAGIAHSQ